MTEIPVPVATGLVTQAGRRIGRGHLRRGDPCQDAHATWAQGGRAAIAVADGLGSCPLSQHGSQAAAEAAVAFLAAAAAWDGDAVRAAFAAAREAVLARAAALGVEPHEVATTLQVAARDGDAVLAGMVGDGAVVAGGETLLAPRPGGYANEVVPLTSPEWAEELQVARRDGAGPVVAFTDGLLRLLLRRDAGSGAWTPFAPFFEAFLPAVRRDPAQLQAFLGRDDVDRAWDDDKALAVILDAA